MKLHPGRLFATAAAVLAILGFAPSGIVHADAENEIVVRVQDQTSTGATTSKLPVAGAVIIVTTTDGAEVARATTSAEGLASLRVAAGADYVVTLDLASLPDGSTMIREGTERIELPASSFRTPVKALNFFTGQSADAARSDFERIAQRFIDGVRLGLIIAMCSVGLSLIFGTTGLTNFAHGELVSFGGLVAFLFNVTMGLPFFVAFPLAVIVGGAMGWLFNWAIFARLTKRGIGLVSQLVVSVGLSIMLRNIYLFQFGGRTRPLRSFSLQEGLVLGPVRITPRDLTTSALSLVILVAVAVFLQRSRTGKAVRAVSDNVALASSTGIDTGRIIRLVWFVGGALAATGGIFRGLDEQVGFQMGSSLLFLMFAGITLGGLGSAYGALVGGFVVGILVEMSTLVVPSELKNAPALIILIIVLIVRPQGILGRRQRVG
jgi:branched-chain amino acid transport system permease protein